MKAIVIENPGPEVRLCWQTVADVQPRDDEILVRVAAAGVNRADLLQCAGHYAPPPGASSVPGLECAGKVVAMGRHCRKFAAGDAVCALLTGGGYAELVAVPEAQAAKIPEGISLTQAASIPEVFATAWANLYMEASAQPGETLLVHAGGSGVGTAAISLAKLMGNDCYVTVRAHSGDKAERCLNLGATDVCDQGSQAFVEAVARWTGGRGVDVILDPVGADYLNDNLTALAMDGRLVLIGLMSGHRIQASLAPVLARRLRILGSTLRNRSVGYKARVMDALQQRLWPALETGDVTPSIDSVYPVTEVAEAHQHMRANGNFGKIVLTL